MDFPSQKKDTPARFPKRTHHRSVRHEQDAGRFCLLGCDPGFVFGMGVSAPWWIPVDIRRRAALKLTRSCVSPRIVVDP